LKQLDKKLEIGSTIHGFSVEKREEIAEFEGIAYIMRHTKSKARLMYLATDDENKAFAITFKTPPIDSTGVFHILEHSVLCGSKKFPVKEPFVNLLKSSMQTFLNAMTFPDKTMYPVASTNEKDLLNLMDVYLDAVLNPRIYEKRAIFEQEGWHYEMDSPEDPLRLNGVVFNEMKGALADPDSVMYNQLCAALFPDTAYAHESGGDPKVIPNLTYENYLDTHQRHYRLDNAYLFLYGSMDIARQLAFLDEKYLGVTQNLEGTPNPLELQAPTVSMNGTHSMQTAPENACVGLAFVTGTIHERTKNVALDILLDTLMGSNEAPLKRALLDSQIADDAHGFFADSQLQPMAIIQLKGVKPHSRETFQKVVTETLERLAQEGLPKDRLEAALSQAEFSIRERDFGIADGVILGIQTMCGWLYDDELATAYLRYEDAFIFMRENLETGYFEGLLKECFLEAKHKACREIIPVKELDEAKESEKLASIKASMSSAEIANIIENAGTLLKLQEEPDTPEALAMLPMLKLDDITGIRPYPAYKVLEDNALPCIYHDLPTRQINYVYHYFELRHLSFDDLPYLGILLRLLGKLDTKERSADELDNLITSKLGSLRFFTECFGDKTDPTSVVGKIAVGASALTKNISFLAQLPQEVWASTLFENTAKIKDVLQQARIGKEQGFANSGHSAALQRARSYYSNSAIISEQINGIDFYLFLKDLLNNFDTRSQDLVSRLYAISEKIFVKNAAISSFTGTPDEYKAFWKEAKDLGLKDSECKESLAFPALKKKNEAFIVPTDICFAAKCFDLRLLPQSYSGAWNVVGKILSLDYLWQELRVKGGAYGGGFKTNRSGGLQFYSYRDPNLDQTLSCFSEASSWIANYEPEAEEMTGYIIATVAKYDAPKKPRKIARMQDIEFIRGLSADWREKDRAEVLGTTPKDIRALSSVFEKLDAFDARCVFGNHDILNTAATNFEIIDLLS